MNPPIAYKRAPANISMLVLLSGLCSHLLQNWDGGITIFNLFNITYELYHAWP